MILYLFLKKFLFQSKNSILKNSRICKILLLGLSLHSSFQIFASHRHLLLSPCTSPTNIETIQAKPLSEQDIFLCSQLSTQLETVNFTGATSTTSGYFGLHLPFMVSTHIQSRILYNLSSNALKTPLDLLIAKWGNSTLTPFSISIGHQKLPFALNEHPLGGFYEFLGTDTFWGKTDLGLNAKYDNQYNQSFEIGLLKPQKNSNEAAFSTRYSWDFPAIDRARMVLSYYNEPEHKSFSLAVINIQNEQQLSFEWIRTYFYKKEFKNHEQLIRVNFTGRMRKKSRTVALYDDATNEYRLGGLGQEYWFNRYSSARLLLLYKKELAAQNLNNNSWIFVLGMGVSI